MKCGPDGCPLVGWESLTPAEKREQRKARAINLYKRGFTQDQIAAELGVSQSQVHKDLDGLLLSNKPPRPKGGRPKGSGKKPRRRTTTPEVEAAIAVEVLDHGRSYEQAANAYNLDSVQPVKTAKAFEEGRRQGQLEASIKVEDLPKAHQERYAILQRKLEREMKLEVQRLAEEGAKKFIDEMLSLFQYQERLDRAEQIIDAHRGIFSKTEFRTLLMCLHPDRSASDQTLSHMLNKIQKHEGVLVKDNERQVTELKFPKTWEEAAEMKRKVAEARKAKKTGNGLHA